MTTKTISLNKIKTGLFILTLVFVLAGCTDAPPPAVIDPDELVADADCAAYILTHGDNNACNRVCIGQCILDGQSCKYDDPEFCIATPGMALDDIAEHLDFYGVDFGPPDEAIPVLIRLGLTIVFSVMGLASLVMGLYGLAIRSTAGENADKAKLAVGILSNALRGTVIGFMSVIITQIVATIGGMSGDIFDLNLIPSTVVINNLSDACDPGDEGYFGAAGTYHLCNNAGEWVTADTQDITNINAACTPGTKGVVSGGGAPTGLSYRCGDNGRWIEESIFLITPSPTRKPSTPQITDGPTIVPTIRIFNINNSCAPGTKGVYQPDGDSEVKYVCNVNARWERDF